MSGFLDFLCHAMIFAALCCIGSQLDTIIAALKQPGGKEG